MSTNRVLQSLKSDNNCSRFNGQFKLDELTRLNDDVCHNGNVLQQNDNINDYMLSNFASCDCNINEVLGVSTQNRGTTVKDGYGISECNINGDSRLRHGVQKRRYKVDQQLFPRPYLTTPNIAKGEFKPDLETRMISSLQHKKHPQMQYYSEKNVFVPLTESLAETIQDPKHIVQETVNVSWIRGGLPSRQFVKDEAYFNESSDNDIVKRSLMEKKQYLASQAYN